MRARALVTACVVAAIMVPYCYALGAIIFHGPLAAFAVRGGSLMLAGTAVLTLIVALTSRFRGALPSPSGIPGAVLATMSIAVAASMVHASAKAAFMTVAALVVVSSVGSGVLVLAIGQLRLSNFFRFIPYPVTAGFFAGAGWVLSVATIGTMSATPIAWDTLALLTEPAMLWRWAPGAVFAAALFVAMRHAPGTFVLLTVLCAGTALFHGALGVLGMPVDQARAAGLLLSGIPDDALWEPFTMEEIAEVDWSVVGDQLPGVLVVAAISLVCVLIHIAGLEASTGTQLDLDREMRSMGMGTIGGGASLAAPGIHALSLCLTARDARRDTVDRGVHHAVDVRDAPVRRRRARAHANRDRRRDAALHRDRPGLDLAHRSAQEAALDGLRRGVPHRAHHRALRLRRGRGGRDAGNARALRRAPQPSERARRALHGARSTQHEAALDPRARHAPRPRRQHPRLQAARLCVLRQRLPAGRPSQGAPRR